MFTAKTLKVTNSDTKIAYHEARDRGAGVVAPSSADADHEPGRAPAIAPEQEGRHSADRGLVGSSMLQPNRIIAALTPKSSDEGADLADAAQLAITTIITDEENAYSTQRAGFGRPRAASYQRVRARRSDPQLRRRRQEQECERRAARCESSITTSATRATSFPDACYSSRNEDK